MDLLRVGAAGAGVPGLEMVLELSRGVATVWRQYQEMRHETVKEINHMKIEMAGVRTLLGAGRGGAGRRGGRGAGRGSALLSVACLSGVLVSR